MLWTVDAFGACEDYLSLPLSSRKKVATSAKHREAIRAVFATSEPVERQMEEAFEIYFQARLKQIPEARRKDIEAYARKIEMQFVSDRQEMITDASLIRLPEDLKKTALPWIIRAHEIEHRIQIQSVVGSSLKRAACAVVDAFVQSVWTYQAEYRAMQAEWEFLNLLPNEIIASSFKILIRKSSQHEFKGNDHFEVFTYMLSGYSLTSEEYVKYHHDQGRYSRTGLLKHDSGFASFIGGVCAVYGAIGMGISSFF